ncbi:MAG: isoaspartyl peptidase/L-asparaginase family protein, partial [Gemmataceae bacterium]
MLACVLVLLAAQPRTVLVIHGGAGVLTEAEMKKEGVTRKQYEDALARALRAGHAALGKGGATSVDAVVAAVRVMEDCGLFNAGRGAAFTSDGRVEHDAALMEGRMDGKGEGKKDPRKRAGAVAAVSHLKNPILAARAVLEMKDGRHVLLAGDGAETFALGDDNRKRYGIERVSNVYFWTDRRLRHIREKAASADRRHGTVGAVAVSADGRIAAGTSTGGLTDKLPGRVGDSPVLGAGTYADDRACGVSGTGTGEVFLRHVVAYDVVARMLYRKDAVGDAARATIDALPDEEDGVG